MTSLVGLIIAKQESTRLKDKNCREFFGQPMFVWNVAKCLGAFDEVWMSSDSDFILSLIRAMGGRTIKRPFELCGDTPNIPVYQHAQKFMNADIIVAVQANSPTIKQELIEKCRDIMLRTNCQELMTCHPDYSIYGSVWALTRERLADYGNPHKPKPDILIIDDSTDIHTLEDFKKAEDVFRKPI